MEFLGAALGGHGDHAAGRLAQVGRVVAGHDLEFLKRILGRGNDENAAAAPVIGFSAIDDPVIVVRTLAVKGNGVALVLSHRGIKIRNGGCGAGYQSRQLDDVAAVGGQIGNLGTR